MNKIQNYRISHNILSKEAEQLTEIIKQINKQPKTLINDYKVQAITLAITYILEAAAVIDSMNKTIINYNE